MERSAKPVSVAAQLLPMVVTAAGFAAIWAWSSGPGLTGTAGWVGHNLWLFAPIGILVAYRGGWKAIGWLAGGLVAGVVLGELIGNLIYQAEFDQLTRQKLDPGYRQDWEPQHLGWAIACVVFLVSALVGAGAFRRRPRAGSMPG
ncbi:hypothetical protein ATK74_2304 [Propionicimonas paludicola]|uniref:Uncharacterized protein n=1 Tax=Propionicimonas paludicola TaxID=185243 RepID=A0A2A9CUC3_9ACTN|nr:hypothetical protein [Propionicimonas paludicola]PFG17731.1 hypothetical protein ATK74_2304 [Propionicimonas paludicola]